MIHHTHQKSLHLTNEYLNPHSHINMAKDNGADLERTNLTGMAPMHVAALEGRPEQVEALLEAGALTEARNDNGMLPVDLASGNVFLKGSAVIDRLAVAE